MGFSLLDAVVETVEPAPGKQLDRHVAVLQTRTGQSSKSTGWQLEEPACILLVAERSLDTLLWVGIFVRGRSPLNAFACQGVWGVMAFLLVFPLSLRQA